MGFSSVNDLSRHTPWLHGVARFYAVYGVVVFGVLLVAGVLLSRRVGLQAVARSALAGVGVLVAVGLNQPLARAVGEARPFTRYPGALVLVHRSTDPSFASDHAVMAGAAAVGLLLSCRRLGLVAVPFALLLAADRVYVGVHYPVDVVAGLALGGLVAAAVQLLARPVTRLLEPLTHGPVRPLLLSARHQRVRLLVPGQR